MNEVKNLAQSVFDEAKAELTTSAKKEFGALDDIPCP
jgi:hypothetical protein